MKSINVLFVITLCLFSFVSLAQSSRKIGVVLLVQMTPEENTSWLAERLQGAFYQASAHPEIFMVGVNDGDSNGKKFDGKVNLIGDGFLTHSYTSAQNTSEKERIARIKKGLETVAQRLKKENKKVTHIVLSGHGNSKDGYFVIGDLAFVPSKNQEVRDLFADIKPLLSKSTKVFLSGCSTFKGDKNQIRRRARLVHDTLGVRETQLFGYSVNMSTKHDQELYGQSPRLVGILSTAAAFLLSPFFFSTSRGAYVSTAIVFLVINGYNYFGFRLWPFNKIRHYRYSDELGFMVTISDFAKSMPVSKGLGSDYFSQYFVHAHPDHPFG